MRLIKTLADNNGNIHFVNENGDTLLHIAVSCCLPYAYALLVRLGLEEKVTNKDGKIPMYHISSDLKKAIKQCLKMSDKELFENEIQRQQSTGSELITRKRSFNRIKTAFFSMPPL